MLQIIAPLMELAARYMVWLYMPALLCFLIGLHFLRDGVLALVLRRDLLAVARMRLAGKLFFQAILGFVAAPLFIIAIHFRKELFQWFAGLI